MLSLHEIEAERGLLTVIVFVSLGSLLVAFTGEHVFDIRPCILCIYQRIPYVVTALAAGAAAALPISSGSRRLAVALCGVVFAAGAMLAAYSVGVEEHWWAGAAGCEGVVPTIFSLDALRGESAMASPLRTCDLDVWRLFGLSLAAYNAIIQIVLAAACLIGMRWITRHRLGTA